MSWTQPLTDRMYIPPRDEGESFPYYDWHGLLDRLPPGEADAVELCVISGKLQKEAAEILGISQMAVCKRLRAAISRMRCMVAEIPDPRWLLLQLGVSEVDIQSVEAFILRGSATIAAEDLGCSPRTAERRVKKCLEILDRSPGPGVELASFLREIPIPKRRKSNLPWKLGKCGARGRPGRRKS